VVGVAVLVAVVGLHLLQVLRLCRVHLRFPVRQRLLLQDKVVEDKVVLPPGPAPAARRQST
jgi:hypothetical protein